MIPGILGGIFGLVTIVCTISAFILGSRYGLDRASKAFADISRNALDELHGEFLKIMKAPGSVLDCETKSAALTQQIKDLVDKSNPQ